MSVKALEMYNSKYERDILEKVKKVFVRTHAVSRWNSRVGPETTLRELEDLFRYKLFNAHSVELLDRYNGIGLLDNDILFAFNFRYSDGRFVIKTFFGRRSTNHILFNLNILDNRSRREGLYVNLDVEKKILKRQIMPYYK